MTTVKLKGGFDELAFLELFCTEPRIAYPREGYWCYEVTDELGITLKFGLNRIQESVQIELKSAESLIGIFSFELVESIEIYDYIDGKFSFYVAPENNDVQTKVNVELRPSIKVDCATLSLCPAGV